MNKQPKRSTGQAIRLAIDYVKYVSDTTLGQGEQDFSNYDLLEQLEDAYEVFEEMQEALKEAMDMMPDYYPYDHARNTLKSVLAKIDSK